MKRKFIYALLMVTAYGMFLTGCKHPSQSSPLLALALGGSSSGGPSSSGSTPGVVFSIANRTFSFPSPMNTGAAAILLAEAFDGIAWNTIPTTGTTFNWTNAQTLVMNLSWKQFPENTQLRFTLSGLQYSGGIPAANNVNTFTTSTVGVSFPVADTGQILCYNASASQACTNPSWPRQDGDYANTPNTRSFTGPTLYGSSDYTTKDNVTGLIWKSCSEGQSGSACATGTATTIPWYNAVNACAYLNAANSGTGYGGHIDWRLPTNQELETLLDYTKYNPSIDGLTFPATQSGNYWAATTFEPSSGSAWVSAFQNSGATYYSSKTISAYTRCVSGSPAPRSFTDSGNGTVKDNVANLVWQKCSAGQNNDASCSGTASKYTWQNALSYCATLSLSSKTWRLPSVNELRSLPEESRHSPAIDTTLFPGTVADWYWASTTVSSMPVWACFVSFFDGSQCFSNSIKLSTYYVRCVATGP